MLYKSAFLLGYWDLWSSWNSCDKRGPIGKQTRKRICNGGNCQGETVQKRNCMYNFREGPGNPSLQTTN